MAVMEDAKVLRDSILKVVKASAMPLTPEDVASGLRALGVAVCTSDLRDALLWLIKRGHLALTPERRVRASR